MGAILSPDFSRTVTQATAKAIFAAARDGGAEPVGVFVEENAEQIVEACQATGLRIVQLHGTNARKALPKLPLELQASAAAVHWQARSFVGLADALCSCAGLLRDAGVQRRRDGHEAP